MIKTDKMFSLGQILSVTGDRLLCTMDGLYEILDYLTRDSNFTHQLPRVKNECKPYILKRYPELFAFDDSKITCENWSKILEVAETKYGQMLPLTPMPKGEHLHIDPVEELGAMIGDEKVIVVESNQNENN